MQFTKDVEGLTNKALREISKCPYCNEPLRSVYNSTQVVVNGRIITRRIGAVECTDPHCSFHEVVAKETGNEESQ